MGERRMYSAVQRLNSLSTISITILVCSASRGSGTGMASPSFSS